MRKQVMCVLAVGVSFVCSATADILFSETFEDENLSQ